MSCRRIVVDLLHLDEDRVYKLIASGDTLGVFQVESSGMREMCRRLKPTCFEDVVAAVALYRPGPMDAGMLDDFINRKHGREKIEYPHPSMTAVLSPTYGTFVYQEQIMQAAQVLAGYTLGGADLLRRAMGKKKKEEMDKQRSTFVKGCGETHGITEARANEIFDTIDKFAGYGFNKSALGGVRGHHVPDGVPEVLLPDRVHGGLADDRSQLDRERRQIHPGVAQPRHRGLAARRERVGGSASASTTPSTTP